MFEQRLTNNSKNILGLLKDLTPPNSYLGGGTALSLWINHRDSYDLDIYSPTEFDTDTMGDKFAKSFPEFELMSKSWQTIHGKSLDTNISLFFYEYKLLEETTDFLGFKIASLKDIAAMKLEAIAGRGLKRDFYDVYKIAKTQKWQLKDIIKMNDEKYDRYGSFTPHILRSMVYFDDAEKFSERSEDVEKEWENVKKFFIQEVEMLSENRLKDIQGSYN